MRACRVEFRRRIRVATREVSIEQVKKALWVTDKAKILSIPDQPGQYFAFCAVMTGLATTADDTAGADAA